MMLLRVVSGSVREKMLCAEEPGSLLRLERDSRTGRVDSQREIDSSIERRMDSGVMAGESGSRKLRGSGRVVRGDGPGILRRGSAASFMSDRVCPESGAVIVASLSLELQEPDDLEGVKLSGSEAEDGECVSGVRLPLRPLLGLLAVDCSGEQVPKAGVLSPVAPIQTASASNDR